MPGQWRVVGQSRWSDMLPSGHFEEGYEIRFEVTSGTQGTIKVSDRNYSPEYVAQRISEAAAAITAVDGMSG